MTKDDRLRQWAFIATEMRNARRAILKEQGFTETTWRDFEDSLTEEVNETEETEYGTIQVVSKPIFQRRIGDKRIGERKRLFLGRNDEQV